MSTAGSEPVDVGDFCSIIFGKGLTDAPAGSFEGLQLTGVFHHSGTHGHVDGPAPEHADYGSFATFSDPDGNGWMLQEIKTRLPGR